MIFNWYSYKIPGIYIYYGNDESIRSTIDWQRANNIDAYCLPRARTVNISFWQMLNLIVLTKLALWTCPYYFSTFLFTSWGEILPIEGFPSFVFPQMALPMYFFNYRFCFFSGTLIFPSMVKSKFSVGSLLRAST